MNKLTYTQNGLCSLGVPGRRRPFLRFLAAIALLTALSLGAARAGDDDTKASTAPATPPEIAPPKLGSNITGLLNFEFSDKYYTPRGLESSKNGISFQPLLILFFDLYNSKTGPLTDLSFNLGIWNDIDSGKNGADPGNWDEIDGFFGMEAKLYKDFKLDAEETFFRSQTNSYETSTNFDFKTTYLDHWFGDSGFSINPYAEIFVETSAKATVAFNYATDDRGFYGSFGIDPTYKFKSIPLTVELPSYVNVVSDDFYQKVDGTPGGSGAAVISTELKGTTPLSFIPISYGIWSAYAGVQYYHLDNAGLEDGNQALTGNTPGSNIHRDHDLYQLHWGMTCFF
jgi:hypothetical protein